MEGYGIVSEISVKSWWNMKTIFLSYKKAYL